jgi:hypothetical protein
VGPGSYDMVAKKAKSALSLSLKEDLQDPELKPLLCSQLVLASPEGSPLLHKCNSVCNAMMQLECPADAGCNGKRP